MRPRFPAPPALAPPGHRALAGTDARDSRIRRCAPEDSRRGVQDRFGELAVRGDERHRQGGSGTWNAADAIFKGTPIRCHILGV